MGLALEGRGFFSKNLFLLTVSAAYLLAAAGPQFHLGWDSPVLALWTAFILALLITSAWRLLRPARAYPLTDIAFAACLILAVNLFSTLLGPGRHWLQPINFLLVALFALYYPLGFSLLVAGLIFMLDGLNLLALPGAAGPESLVNLGVFGAYLAGAALVLGRLFQAEHKKKERVLMAVKRLHDGARNIETEDPGKESIGFLSPEERMGRLVDSAALLDKALEDLLSTAASVMPAGNALLFMPASGGESLYPRVYIGDGNVLGEAVIPIGQGLVGWVAKERKPLLANGRVKGLGYLKNEDRVSSFIAAPILNGGTLEGVIALDSPDSEAFTDQDKEALSRFAGLALYLLQNAREYQEVDFAAKNFAAMHRISTEVSASLDLKTILEKLALLSHEILPYDYLTVSFMEGDDKVRFKTLKGYDGITLPRGPLALSGSLLEWIVENRQPLSFCDLDQRTDRLPIFPAKELQAGCRSFLGIPFLSQDKVLGVLTLASRQPDAISGYQQHMLSIIANQVAVNIANARLHHMMQQMATTDGLTGLINHRHFQEKADTELARAARYAEPVSVLLFDIDHFKKVNDTYGHPAGDSVLKQVARILKEAVRTSDIAARYGGEEFVSLLVNTDLEGARVMAERIRSSIEKNKFVLDGKNIPVTVSVGYSSFPADGKEKGVLIEKADQALYYAKGHGRNQCCAARSLAGPSPAEPVRK